MTYGVTPVGFERPRLPEIRTLIIEDLKARLRAAGLSDDIQTRPDSLYGLLIDTFAERETALWEMGEGVYYAMYPGSATGVALDRAVSFTGVERRAAERARAAVMLYGAQGTTVPSGAQIRNSVTQTLWAMAAPVVISATNAADVTIVPEMVNSATYTVTVDGVDYEFTASAAATTAEVLGGLVAALSGSPAQVSSTGATLRLLLLSSTAMSVQVSSNLTISRLGASGVAETLEPSTEEAKVSELNAIVTLIEGWDAVENLQLGTAGRMQETDAELAGRYDTGLFRLGAAVLPSIGPNIRDSVPGVTQVKVLENDTNDVNDIGDLPHSIHVVVEGGLDVDIAAAIYKFKAGGIDTNGDVSITLQTDEGPQVILFDRPEPVYIWVRAELTLLPASEQAFPPDGLESVAAAILAAGSAHTIGQDVILQRFFCGIYAVKGLAGVDLQLASSTDPGFVPESEDFSAANVSIDDLQIARFDATRIEVV